MKGSCLSMQHGKEPDSGSLKGSHLDVGVLRKLVCARQTGGASADNDDVSLSILIQVLEVAAGHGAAHLQVHACRHHPGTARYEGSASPASRLMYSMASIIDS